VDECTPLVVAHLKDILQEQIASKRARFERLLGMGLHSSTFRLNVSAFCGIGGALRGCLGGVWG